jgi:hypothetical protein
MVKVRVWHDWRARRSLGRCAWRFWRAVVFSHAPWQAKAGGKAPRKARKTAAKTEGGDDKKGRKRKANTNSYASYIYKVLKQVHPDTGVSKKAMVIMDSFGTWFTFFFFFGAQLTGSFILFSARSVRAHCLRVWPPGALQQAPHHLVARDPDVRAPGAAR